MFRLHRHNLGGNSILIPDSAFAWISDFKEPPPLLLIERLMLKFWKVVYIHRQIAQMVVCLMSVTGQENVGLNIAHSHLLIKTGLNKLSANKVSPCSRWTKKTYKWEMVNRSWVEIDRNAGFLFNVYIDFIAYKIFAINSFLQVPQSTASSFPKENRSLK